jgi:hypothetical protein
VASHAYLMPLVTVTTPFGPRPRPKYAAEAGLTTWGFIPFDELNGTKLCIIAAVVTPAQDTLLRSKSDVVATPLPQNASARAKAIETQVLTVARNNPDFADLA